MVQEKALCCGILFSLSVSYVDDDDNGIIVPEERPQRRVPVAQDNEDLVVKGNASTLCHDFFFGSLFNNVTIAGSSYLHECQDLMSVSEY